MENRRPDWYTYSAILASAAATRSEDPFCRVGAVVLASVPHGRVVLGMGYNGTVQGVDIDWEDRDARRPYVIHAEANALRYTTPTLAEDGLLAVTHFPCSQCVVLARSYGIHRITWTQAPDWNRYPAEPVLEVCKRLGIHIFKTDLR